MTIQYRMAHRAETDDPEGPLRFVIATEGRKGDGIDLKMANADLGRYQANPVVMALHDYGRLPVGRAENVTVEDGRLLADAIFDLDDPTGAEIDRKYRGGFMSAVSVGFDVYDVNDQGVPARWELLEFSAVPIPMDGDALVESGRQARALAEVLAEVRTGRPDDDAIARIVEDTVARLRATETVGNEEPPAASRLALAKLRLKLHEAA